MKTMAFDPGYSSIKMAGESGTVTMPSAVSIWQGASARSMAGLRRAKAPLTVTNGHGSFYVGDRAHTWGRPVENLDLDRLSGTPEMEALFLGALTRHGVPAEPIRLIVGLPIASLLEDRASVTQRQVRQFFKGTHYWNGDGVDYSADVADVQITSQPVGAMFDYLLDDHGKMSPDRTRSFKAEIGIMCIGMNTVELLVVQGGAPVQRFVGGEAVGVRRLLEIINEERLYSLAELDAQLRSGSLDVGTRLSVWEREVMGYVERRWGNSYRRFANVIVVGGGALLLKRPIMAKFGANAYIPADPVLATVRGLFKYALMKANRRRSRGQAR